MDEDYSKFRGIPLREVKYAQTKFKIYKAFINELDTTSFDSINIDALCKGIGISRRAFFNYFPYKSYVLLYMVQISIIEIAIHTFQKHGKNAGLELICTGFKEFGKRVIQYPDIIFEAISCLYKKGTDLSKFSKLTNAEEILWNLDTSILNEVPTLGFRELTVTAINNAVLLNELPEGIRFETVEMALNSILFGIPLSLKNAGLEKICEIYQEQLNILWAGLRAKSKN
ncbi:MAG: TetR/AcrR family transcriptional regulator [Clostridia bacterium]|nr:TetR/AcrR family transcriptional regulator [Clostridia bacterium]